MIVECPLCRGVGFRMLARRKAESIECGRCERTGRISIPDEGVGVERWFRDACKVADEHGVPLLEMMEQAIVVSEPEPVEDFTWTCPRCRTQNDGDSCSRCYVMRVCPADRVMEQPCPVGIPEADLRRVGQ